MTTRTNNAGEGIVKVTSKLTKAQKAVIKRMQAGEVLNFDSMKKGYHFVTPSGWDSVTVPARALLKKGFIKISVPAPFYTKPMVLTADGINYEAE
ncbi:hypothetical protein N0P70_005432 [Klebsiella michiganensis]|nr:hypothetical protein [Klebsiella michiganensis]